MNRSSVMRTARLGAAAVSVLVVLALVVQLARSPAMPDESGGVRTDGVRLTATEPGEATAAALPVPAPQAIAELTAAPSSSEEVEALLASRRWIEGQVVRAADGTPLAGARVRALPTADSNPGELLGDDGRFKLWPRVGTDALEVRLQRDDGWRHLPQTYPVEPGPGRLAGLRLEYRSGFTLTGSVRDPEGQPIAGATVMLLLSGPIERYQTVLADEQGRYRLDDLEPAASIGALRVSATAPGFLSTTATLPVIADGPLVQMLDLQLLLAGAIEVRALVAADEFAVDAIAMVLTPSGEFFTGQRTGRGSVRIGGLPAGPHTLVVGRPLRARRELEVFAPARIDGVQVEHGRTTSLDVTLERAATIMGRVTDAAGVPLRKAQVQLELSEPAPVDASAERASPQQRYDRAQGLRHLASSVPGSSCTTDAEGRFELRAVPAGAVHVSATAAGLVQASIALDVAAGETRRGVDFALQPGVELRGRVQQADGSPIPFCTGVLLLPAEIGSDVVLARAETRRGGEFRTQAIAPGPKRLLVVGKDGSWLETLVDPGGEPQIFVTGH